MCYFRFISLLISRLINHLLGKPRLVLEEVACEKINVEHEKAMELDPHSPQNR